MLTYRSHSTKGETEGLLRVGVLNNFMSFFRPNSTQTPGQDKTKVCVHQATSDWLGKQLLLQNWNVPHLSPLSHVIELWSLKTTIIFGKLAMFFSTNLDSGIGNFPRNIPFCGTFILFSLVSLFNCDGWLACYSFPNLLTSLSVIYVHVSVCQAGCLLPREVLRP